MPPEPMDTNTLPPCALCGKEPFAHLLGPVMIACTTDDCPQNWMWHTPQQWRALHAAPALLARVKALEAQLATATARANETAAVVTEAARLLNEPGTDGEALKTLRRLHGLVNRFVCVSGRCAWSSASITGNRCPKCGAPVECRVVIEPPIGTPEVDALIGERDYWETRADALEKAVEYCASTIGTIDPDIEGVRDMLAKAKDAPR